MCPVQWNGMFELVPYNEEVTCVKTATEFNNEAIMWAYSFLICENLLIDTGCANAKSEMEAFKEEHTIRQVVITHAHEDHSGCASIFDGLCPIYAPDDALELIENPPILSEFFQFVWGQPEPVRNIGSLPDTISVCDLNFEFIPLVGHSESTMIGLFEEERGWLFSSDAVPLPSKKRIAMDEENVPDIIATMERLLELEPTLLFDSHRGPVENPIKHIQVRIDYLKDMQKKIKSLHDGGLTIDEIQDRLGLEGPWYLEHTAPRFGINHFIRSLLEDSPTQ